RLEARVLLLRRSNEFPHPVLDLLAPRLGDAVDPALGPVSMPISAGHLDEPVLLEVLDHGVERSPVDLDAVLLAAPAQHGSDLVGMHGSLGGGAGGGQGDDVSD